MTEFRAKAETLVGKVLPLESSEAFQTLKAIAGTMGVTLRVLPSDHVSDCMFDTTRVTVHVNASSEEVTSVSVG